MRDDFGDLPTPLPERDGWGGGGGGGEREREREIHWCTLQQTLVQPVYKITRAMQTLYIFPKLQSMPTCLVKVSIKIPKGA